MMIKNFDKTVAAAKDMFSQYPPIETLTRTEVYFLGSEKHTLTVKDGARESEINRLTNFIANIGKYDDKEVNKKITQGIKAGIRGIEFAKIIYDRFVQSIEIIDVSSAAYYFGELNNALKVIDSELE